ncbi:MAG: hydroxymethylglutaryl-CoA synthase [Euryarchaeota archaeon]|nr:hydroxymethylglutaryl-CoA synthase [Euryarchaeota archaeon]
MVVGIVSYGACIPRYRISSEDIARVWGQNPPLIGKQLGVFSKSVPSSDEDVVTLAVEAARTAMRRSPVAGDMVNAVYVGSESHPYAVKPTAGIVAEAIGATPNLTAADFEFACKAGTAAMQSCMGLVGSGMMDYGMAIGADTSQGAPGDALEYSASAGAAAILVGKKNLIATIEHTCSYTTDTPDFWRREGQIYPQHGGRFTGAPAYFKHILACGRDLMKAVSTGPGDYKYAIFHQPNGKFPLRVAEELGFKPEQVRPGLLAPEIGNTYSAAVPLGLAAVLDIAVPGDRIFVTAYGSGAGSDAFDITVVEAINSMDRTGPSAVRSMIERKVMIDYATYAKLRGKITMGGASR